MYQTNKEEFRALSKKHKIPIQFTPEWMDAVCIKGDWDVAITKDNKGNWSGILVYHYRKIFGIKIILMPSMTFYNGIYFFYPDNITPYKKTGFENKVCEILIAQLPKHHFYYQQFHHSFTNWSPLFWNKFKQTTRYTYIIDSSKQLLKLEELKPSLKRNIVNASQVCEITKSTFDAFWLALDSCYKNRSIPFSKAVMLRINKNLENKENCLFYLCKEKSTGSILAGSFIVNDQISSYYVAGFYNPERKDISGISYLLWHHIENNNRLIFDFEGSMIQNIEFFFRGFGATLTPVSRIWKCNSSLLKLLFKIKFKDLL